MKILIVGDLHLRTRPPARRREVDFAAVCLGKLVQIVRIGRERADAIIQVGDFFDSPDPSLGLIAKTILVLQGAAKDVMERTDWYAIHGQHDLRYHSQEAAGRSALRVLEAAKCLWMIDDEEGQVDDSEMSAALFGVSFGQEPPTCPNVGFNVLVAHAMVGDKPLWSGHDLTGPEQYVRKYPGYALYCLGDYHYPFSARVGDAWVINPGAVLRLTADERDCGRRPKVVLFDTDTRQPEDIYLDVAPEAEAFDLEGMEKDFRAEGASFAGMADALKRTGKLGVNFKENLAAAMDAAQVEPGVRDRIWLAWRRIIEGKGGGG